MDNLTRIFEGPEGRLWFMSHSGNVAYNPATETFIRNTDSLLRNYSVAYGVVTHVKKDKFDRFWFAHYNQGLFCYDRTGKKTTKLAPDENDSTTIATNQISSLSEDQHGNIWVVHQNGTFEKVDHTTMKVVYRNHFLRDRFKAQLSEYYLFVDSDDDLWAYNRRDEGCFFFDMKRGTVMRLHTTADKGRLRSNIVSSVLQGDDQLIWIGTENGGLNLFNKKDFSVRYLLNDETDAKSLADNTVQSLYKDKQGIMWIGSYKSGVSYYHPDIFRFDLYKHEFGRPESLPFNDINAFAEDPSGNIWIGTNGAGLVYFDRQREKFSTYTNLPGKRNSLTSNVVVSLLMDKQDDVLWIGTYYGGLNKYDRTTFTSYLNVRDDPKSLGDNSVWEIYQDSHLNLWLGTLRGGLDVYHRAKGEFFHYRSGDINSIHTTYVPAILEDSAGNMWVGTGYGLEVLQKSSGRFVQYLHTPDVAGSISGNNIQSLYQDSRGWIWVGTNGGLNRYNPQSNNFTVIREQDGLAHNSILALTEDNQNNLWISTPRGLTKLSVTNTGNFPFSFQNYYESDGLIHGTYHENAFLKCASGELIFGGSGGFNVFDPARIRTDSTAPPLVLTDFQVSNQSVGIGQEVGGTVILPVSIGRARKIVLGPESSFFSIEFAALNYFHPEKSQYKYLLEGFQDSWITTTANQRRVTFTNLDPGDYIFRVAGSNSDGLWNGPEAVLRITILPPFWKSNVAFALYALLILVALMLGRQLVVARERLKFSIQSERDSAQKLHEFDMMKIKFFTNVSHELRTPLTLIITPLEKLIKNAHQADDKKQFQVIYRNAKRLLNLVNQLLDFKKMESDEFNLNPSEGDIVQFIRDLVGSFSDLSDKKNIHLTFNASIEKQETFFDMDKVEKIMFNLLSNAFKFTPDHGHVSVDVDIVAGSKSKYLQIRVSDTGIGIPPDKKQKIFERFYQHDLPETMVNQGSGIGLSITQEFVKLHGGTIDVESKLGEGSTFLVRFPILDIHGELSDEEVEAGIEETTVSGNNGSSENGNGRPTLMLVEDNEDFRVYLKDSLRSDYNIIEAANGRQGFDKAISLVPDLIVSDIMMPELDGIELCRRIKQDARTSHIPVILLTARTAQEQEIEGFQSGANDYITKPFSFEILETRIQNLLSLRSLGHKQFQKHLDIKVSEIEVASVDEKLIREAVKLVEENLVNKDFSVEEMSRMLAMSRVHLYKKLHSLTGKTPIEFIRFIRIQRAAQLLEKSNLTVSEVAYQVGFNHPKYFARYFRDVYKVLPSQYAAAHRSAKAEPTDNLKANS